MFREFCLVSVTNNYNNLRYNYIWTFCIDKWRKDLEERLKTNIVHCRPTGVKLGKGAYSTVIQLRSEGSEDVNLAGKVFKAREQKEQYDEQKLIDEIDIMVYLNHSNIVDCKGVCFLPTSMLPVLVMEQLTTTLHAYLLDPVNSNLPVERKMSFLLDIARGLHYLHSNTPAIIHRDLTAKNVLLDSQLQRAKITDFGNSRIMEFDSGYSGSLTTAPGTFNYMPPEAQGESSTYNTSLDVFSFGHLSLFTITQTPIHTLPPPSYVDSTGEYYHRSEVERREKFFKVAAEKVLSESHPLLELIRQCLNNKPSQRPQTLKLVTTLSSGKHNQYE